MTATQAKPTATTALPDLIALAAADYDRARSTPWHERYTVAYDVSERTWTCNGRWCGRAKWCKHRQLAATLKGCLWWEALLADATPANLRSMLPAKQRQVRWDCDALSAWAAMLTIQALLAAAGESEAAVAA